MNDATCGADNIRNDISALAQRYTVIDWDEQCGVMVSSLLMFVLLHFFSITSIICLYLYCLFLPLLGI